MTAALPIKHKPFNLEHAKAGAPIASDDGVPVRILCWDRKHPTHPIIAIEEIGDHEAIAFRANCCTEFGGSNKLVMMPLGYIDGKPVFVGDEIEDGGPGDWTPSTAYPCNRDFKNCRWPAPEREYPKFDGSIDALSIEYNKSKTFAGGLVLAANAALRHAIDAGQVVTAGDHDAAIKAQDVLLENARAELQRTRVEKQAFYGIVNVGTVYGTVEAIECIKAQLDDARNRRAARDMAVAEAVRAEIASQIGPMVSAKYGISIDFQIIGDLAAIIAKVPA